MASRPETGVMTGDGQASLWNQGCSQADNCYSIDLSTRGTSEGLLIGLGIAIPSGIGVALSVLGNNTGSLVGVAISAALLPPAVNCGLLWGFASITSCSITS